MTITETNPMNLRLVLKNNQNKTVYCVISKNTDIQLELEKVFSIQKGYGFSVDCFDTCIKIVDYFAGETRATFEIISQEDTPQDVQYYMKEL